MIRAESIDRTMRPLFHAVEGGSIPTSALDLRFSVIDQDRADELNGLWHSRCADLGGGGSRVCYIADGGGIAHAVAVWTNPTAPKLPQLACLMLKRYAIADDRPKNTASRMLGWMIRDIQRRLVDVTELRSYSDPDTHYGTIYRATGWVDDGIETRTGAGWRSRDRKHTTNDAPVRVQRWIKKLQGAKP